MTKMMPLLCYMLHWNVSSELLWQSFSFISQLLIFLEFSLSLLVLTASTCLKLLQYELSCQFSCHLLIRDWNKILVVTLALISSWQQQAITWTNVDISSVRSCNNNLKAIALEMVMEVIIAGYLKITHFKSKHHPQMTMIERQYWHKAQF